MLLFPLAGQQQEALPSYSAPPASLNGADSAQQAPTIAAAAADAARISSGAAASPSGQELEYSRGSSSLLIPVEDRDAAGHP